MEDKYNYQKGFEEGLRQGKKKGLRLAIDVVGIYDTIGFTTKGLQKEVLAHLRRDLKSIKGVVEMI